MTSRFIQLHTLTSYPASLLNRDDVGFAKRIPFGGTERTRVSSQCLKRHWRRADDENALGRIQLSGDDVPMSVRSRRTFQEHVYKPLVEAGTDPGVAEAVVEEVMAHVLPAGKAKKAKKEDEEVSLDTSQVTVIGRPEVEYLRSVAEEAAAEADDAKAAKKAVKERFKGPAKKNLQNLTLGAGLDAALFGRMVTGDVLARCDAAIHVAHAFTVHDGYVETDYFSAVDDLQGPEETGSGHINTAELSTGLFYGYVVVDLPLLVSNLEGCARQDWQGADRSLAAEVVRRLTHLVATVSPGAKLGATAPYAHALAVLAETGDRQPRTLANAFLEPVAARGGLLHSAYDSLARHLGELDGMYGRTTARRLAAVEAPDELLERVDERTSLPELAGWLGEQIEATA